jgi:RNA recognition motif-containing protein
MFRVIQIGNLDDSVNEQELTGLFARYGAVRAARVARHSESGLSTGVGFVEMELDAEGDAAVAALRGREHQGRILMVSWSNQRTESDADQSRMFGSMNMPLEKRRAKDRVEQRGLPGEDG